MFIKWLRFLGSINLALLLLAVLIVACIAGTLYERKLDADVARAYVYGAWWFTFWLMLLVTNLFCAAAVRFPWRRDQYAFVITHAGIIIILFGGLIDRRWGVEGSMRLKEGEAPVNRMHVPGNDLAVEVDGVPGIARTPISMGLLKERPSSSFPIASPADDVRVDVVDAQPVAPRMGEVEPASDGFPAVQWRFKSPMMREQSGWIFLGEEQEIFKDLAVIRFTRDASAPKDKTASLQFYFDSSGQLQYRRSSSSGSATGPVEIGKELPLQWGPDSVFAVDRFLPSGRPQLIWVPASGPQAQPGLRCRVETPQESALVWVSAQNASAYSAWQEVRVGGRTVRISIADRTAELPFSVQLVKFDAPYHEGLESMGRFAKFQSLLRFDGQAGSEQTASMNNPATYPATWWGPAVGASFRISQSGHDMPRNPDVSIVQILRDPGWFPKWFGSLLVCGGIFWMFYLRRPPVDRTAASDTREAP